MSPSRALAVSLPPAPSDASLVERALGGDRWAEEALYRRHVHRVTTVVARLVRHGPDVEDIVQDTFVRAFQDLASLRDPDAVGRWLVASAVHRVHKLFRRRRLMRLLGLDRSPRDEPISTQPSTDASPEVRAELALLDRSLDRMRDEDRVCWVLRYLVGHRLDEVAELAECSLATVKRRIARAQSAVAVHFGEEAPHD